MLSDASPNHFLDQRGGHGPVHGKLHGSFRDGVVRQFLFKLLDDRGSREKTAMISEGRKIHQRLLELERGNAVADGLGGLRRQSGLNGGAHLFQRAAGRLWNPSQIFIDVLRRAASLHAVTAHSRFLFHAAMLQKHSNQVHALGRSGLEIGLVISLHHQSKLSLGRSPEGVWEGKCDEIG
jgi:hypothetical protein